MNSAQVIHNELYMPPNATVWLISVFIIGLDNKGKEERHVSGVLYRCHFLVK